MTVDADGKGSDFMSNEIGGAESLEALANLARHALESDDLPGAIAHADKLIEVYPDRRQGFIFKARALVSQRRVAEALQTLRTALARQEGDAKLLSFARNIAFQHDGIEAAWEYVLRLSKIVPGDLKNEMFVIEWYLSSGKSDCALSHADALLQAFPNAAQCFMLKAQAL